MDIFFNPCRCQCDKEVTKSELIVIMKTNSLQKIGQRHMISSQSKASTIAMEPKNMEVRRQSILNSKKLKQVNFNDLEFLVKDSIFKSFENYTQNTICKNFQRISVNETMNMKSKTYETNPKNFSNVSNKNEKILKQKSMNCQIGQMEGQTQRKTLKKHNFRPKEIKDQAKDLLLTTKRCKKHYNNQSPPSEQNKQNILVVQQGQKHKLVKKIDENEKIIIKQEVTKQQYKNECKNSIKLMGDEIDILKMQLKRLQEDQMRLLRQKDKNEMFFKQDFEINEKKKQNIKKSCNERFSEIRDLKKLLNECKNRKV